MRSRLPDGTAVHTVQHPSGNLTVLLPKGDPPKPARKAGSIQWYVPHTKTEAATVASAPRDAIWVDVSVSNIAYYAALHDIWARGESFALLEHDVICRPDVIEAFETCPEPWCVFAYDACHPECREAWANMLGCTRFRGELIEQVPDALSSIPPDGWDWHNLCDRVAERLRAKGFTHHWHSPVVDHWHHQGLT